MSVQGKKIIVTGASRGLGRGMALASADAGATVVAVARSREPLAELATRNPEVRPVVGDVADPRFVLELLQREDPDVVVLNAGAAPLLRPLYHHTWETFSQNWHVDVKAAFLWFREALLLPLRPGAHIVAISSGAALRGSPLSGGYAGAKRTVALVAQYAAVESARLDLGLEISVVYPQLNPNTDLGRAGVEAYAARAGMDAAAFAKRFDPPLSPDIAGRALLDLLATPERGAQPRSTMLTGRGLAPVPS